MGNPPEVTSDENSYAEIDDSRTIPDVPINKGYLTKITAERARRERPDFITPATTNEIQKAIAMCQDALLVALLSMLCIQHLVRLIEEIYYFYSFTLLCN